MTTEAIEPVIDESHLKANMRKVAMTALAGTSI
jgi:hypothetical protein